MKLKPSVLKTILTTASATAMIISSVNVVAANYYFKAAASTNIQPANPNQTWFTNPACTVPAANPPSQGDILFFEQNVPITFIGGQTNPTLPGQGNSFSIDFSDSNGVINIGDTVSYTFNGVNAGGAVFQVTYADSGIFTINDTQGALSNVDFNNKTATLIINNGDIGGNINNGSNATLILNNNSTLSGNTTLGNLAIGGNAVTLSGANIFTINATQGSGSFESNDAAILVGNFGSNTPGNVLNLINLTNNGFTFGNGGAGANLVSQAFTGVGGNNIIAENSSITATTITNNQIVINGGKTLTLNGNLTNAGLTLDNASTIDGDGNPNGALTLNGKVIINSRIADNRNLTTIQLGAGANVTFNADVSADNLVYTGMGSIVNLGSTVLNSNIDFGNYASTMNISTSSLAALQISNGTNATVNFTDNGTFTNNNATINILGTTAGKTVTLPGANIFNISSTTGQGSLTTTDQAVLVGNFGALGNGGVNILAAIDFGADQFFFGDAGFGANIVAQAVQTTGPIRSLNIVENSSITSEAINNLTFTINQNKTLTLNGTLTDGGGNIIHLQIDNNTTIAGDGNAGTQALITNGNVIFGTSLVGSADLALIINGGNLTTAADYIANGTTIKNGGTLALGDNLTSNISFGSGAGTVNVGTKTLTGNVDLTKNGTLTVANGGSVVGNVTSADSSGTFNLGGGVLQGNIGSVGNPIGIFNTGQTGAASSTGHNIYAKTTNIGALGFTLSNGDSLNGNVVVGSNSTFIANSGNITGNISGSGTLDINVAPDSSSFKATTSNIGSINFNQAGTIDRSYSSSGTITVTQNTTLASSGSLSGNNVSIASGTTLTSSGMITLLGGGAVYGDGTFKAASGGNILQLGSSSQTLANAVLTQANNQPTTYNVSGTSYVADMTVESGVTLDSSTSGFVQNGNIIFADNANVNLGSNILAASGTAEVQSILNVNVSVGSSGRVGSIASTSTNLGGKTINITIAQGSTPLQFGTTLSIFSNSTGTPANIKVTGGGLNNFTLQADGTLVSSVNQVVTQNSSAALLSLSPNLGEVAALIMNTGNQTRDAAAFIGEIYSLLSNPATAVEAVEVATRVQENTSIATAAVNENTLNSFTQVINNSSGAFSNIGGHTTQETEAAGQSSGSEEDGANYGLWVKAYGGNALQKMKKGNAGYKSTTSGVVIGVDGLVKDDLSIGIAATYGDSFIKMKNQKAGDKVAAKSLMISLYGLYKPDYKWFIKTMATFGTTNITDKELKLSNGIRSISTGNYTSQSYSIDLGLGYIYKPSKNIKFIPEAGLKSIVSNDGAYTEVGGSYKRTVIKRSGLTFQGSLGGTLSSNIYYNEMNIIPAIHAKLMQQFGNKTSKVSMQLEGQNGALISKNKPANKTIFNIGTDLTLKSGMIEYGVGYDAFLASKYVAQTGVLKIRVNF